VDPRGSALTILHLAPAVRNAALDLITAAIDAGAGPGTISFCDGPMPASASDALAAGNHLLSTVTCDDPSAPPAVGGVLTLAATVQDSSIDQSGTVTFARVRDSNGVTVLDADVGTSNATIIMPSTSVTAGEPLQLSTFTVTWP